jgi:outer membrane lipoprotein-sorting protein
MLLMSGCATTQYTPTSTPIQQATSASITPTPTPTANPNDLPISIATDPSEIRLRMILSHLFWNTVWMDATVTGFGDDGTTPIQQSHQQIWVDRENFQFRVISGSPDGDPTFLQVSDGNLVVLFDATTAQQETQELPPSVKDPFTPPIDQSDTVYPYPLAMSMSTPLSDLVFPTGMAQNTSELVIIGEDAIAGRNAIVVDRLVGEGFRLTRMWVDSLTGMVLKSQDFSKSDSDKVSTELIVNQIQVDVELPDELFSTIIGSMPTFTADYAGTPVEEIQVENIVTSTQWGTLYFAVMERDGLINLKSLPADCVILRAACPEATVVPGYPNINGMINPLIWSPDGTQAALVVTVNDDVSVDKLYLYAPNINSWIELATFQYISTPVWSLNSKTITFIGSMDQQVDVYAVDAKGGSPIFNLTQRAFLGEEQALSIAGWVNNALLVSHSLAGRTLEYFALPLSGEGITPVENLSLAGGYAVPSPAQQFIATVTYDDKQNVSLSILDHQYNPLKTLSSFQKSGISTVIWTPDSNWIIFEVIVSTSPDNAVATIYAVHPDGTGMQALATNTGGNRLAPSPDSQYVLLLSRMDNSRMTILSLNMEPSVLVKASGIPLDTFVEGISWQTGQ